MAGTPDRPTNKEFPGLEPVIDVSAEDKEYLTPVQARDVINLTGDIASLTEFSQLRQGVVESIAMLTPAERAVLKGRFGLVDGKGRSVRELGREMEMPKSTVYDAERRALAKIRNPRIK